MPHPRHALSPDNLHLIGTVARCGSLAAAARELGMVPSALTYRVRQVEDALDVLLFDRRSRRATLTRAGQELLRASEHLLRELDAVALRVRRIATGWEPELTLAADAVIASAPLFDLCHDFYALQAPTRLRLRTETLSGTLEALLSGQADLALGVALDGSGLPGLHSVFLGEVEFVFVVAQQHALASAPEPLTPAAIQPHRVVAVADTAPAGRGQIAAMFFAMIGTLIPAVQFAGLINPVSSLEGAGRWIGEIYPASHMFIISRGVFSKALGFSDLHSSFLPLLIAAPTILVAAILLLKKQEA